MSSTSLYTRDPKGRIRRREQPVAKALPVAPFFLLGLFLPIDILGPVPPIAFDMVRYGLALMIVLMLYSRRQELAPNQALGWVSLLLTASGALALVKAFTIGGDPFTAAVAFISPLVAFLVARQNVHHRWILIGFVVGCTFSAIDIIMQATGLPFLGNPSLDEFRFSGFSFGSTKVAPLLAVALCLVISPWAWVKRRVLLRLVVVALLVSALFLSQGRGGLAGFLAAVGVLAYVHLPRRPLVGFAVVFVALPALYFAGAFSALMDFVTRDDAPIISGDLTSGRSALNSSAWDGFLSGGLLGVDPSIRHLYNPHLAPLTSGVDVGFVGFVATSVVCLMLIYTVFLAGRLPVAFRMISAVALVAALIEPHGFFIGFSGAMLVALTFAQYARSEVPVESGLTPRPAATSS